MHRSAHLRHHKPPFAPGLCWARWYGFGSKIQHRKSGHSSQVLFMFLLNYGVFQVSHFWVIAICLDCKVKHKGSGKIWGMALDWPTDVWCVWFNCWRFSFGKVTGGLKLYVLKWQLKAISGIYRSTPFFSVGIWKALSKSLGFLSRPRRGNELLHRYGAHESDPRQEPISGVRCGRKKTKGSKNGYVDEESI